MAFAMRILALLAATIISTAPAVAQDSPEAAARLAQQAQAEAERARQEAERAAADARAQAAADRARMAHEEAERLAAEGRRRADPASAREQAIAAEYARRRSEDWARTQAAQSEADLARRAAEQHALAAEEAARGAEVQRPPTGPRPQTRDLPPELTAPRRRQPARRTAAQPSRMEAPSRLIEMKEGIVLCQPDPGDQWRCSGPFRIAYGNIETSRTVVAEACGAGTVRDLGTVRGFRVFGCGFGVNPRSASPGNRDVPELYRVDIPRRAVFRCPQSTDAHCRHR